MGTKNISRRNGRKGFAALAVAGVVASGGGLLMVGRAARAATTYDLFNSDTTNSTTTTGDESPDPTTDPIFTTVANGGSVSVNGSNSVTIGNTGILTTTNAFAPPVTVSGDVSISGAQEFHIYTRSTGTGNSATYNNVNGLRFGIKENGSSSIVFIDNYGGTGTGNTTSNAASYTNFNIAANDLLAFTVTDSGTGTNGVSLTVNDLTMQASTHHLDQATITDTSTYVNGTNDLVSFSGNPGANYTLDNVTISSAVPEPATIGLLALGGLGILGRKRRKA